MKIWNIVASQLFLIAIATIRYGNVPLYASADERKAEEAGIARKVGVGDE